MAATKRGSRKAGRRRPSRAKARRKPARRPARAAARKRPARKAPRRKAPPKRKARTVKATRRPRRQAPRSAPKRPVTLPSTLGRNRRQLSEEERLAGPSSGMAPDRMSLSAKAGHDELRSRLRQHTETSPELTAGDPDARWEDAYAVGDEAPGGDNPTPDQDRVDDIGKALGIRYRDDEELKGGDEVRERDRHRWELDPASAEDYDEHEP